MASTQMQRGAAPQEGAALSKQTQQNNGTPAGGELYAPPTSSSLFGSLFGGDPFFDALAGGFFPGAGGGGALAPQLPRMNERLLRTDIRENAQAIEVHADVPGIDKANVKVEVDANNVLTISCNQEKKAEDRSEQPGGWRYYRQERSSMAGTRSIKLPQGVDVNRIDAKVENGVLSVTVPKMAQTQEQRRRINVA